MMPGIVGVAGVMLSCRSFEIYPDPVMPEITYFCLPQMLPVLKNLGTFMQEVWAVVFVCYQLNMFTKPIELLYSRSEFRLSELQQL